MRQAAFVMCLAMMTAAPVLAQDPVQVDSKHYKVEFENEHIRVVRITYGPHEKSVMHHHPPNVGVFLTDGHGKMTTPDGKTQDMEWKAGTTQWDPGGNHLPENAGDTPFELVVVELKK
jgi:quercetin dioxygenase-like cupin family protein